MKTLSIFFVGAFGMLALLDLFHGKYYVSVLELIIALHSLSDYYAYKTKEAK